MQSPITIMKHPGWELCSLEPKDLPIILEISSLGGYTDWTWESFASCFKENYYVWGVKIDTKLCGFLIILVNLDEIEILNLAVHPLKQRQGIADYLLQRLIEFSCQNHIRQIHLEVHVENLPAIHLYQKHGFEKIGKRPNYYVVKGKASDALLLSRKLIS